MSEKIIKNDGMEEDTRTFNIEINRGKSQVLTAIFNVAMCDDELRVFLRDNHEKNTLELLEMLSDNVHELGWCEDTDCPAPKHNHGEETKED